MADDIITTANGRKLKLRKLDVLAQARLLRAIGPAQSQNEPYVMLVRAAAAVSEIDGVPVPMPTSEPQIDAAIARLDDDGFAAFTAYFERKVAEVRAAAEAALDGEAKPADPLARPAS